MPIRGDDEIGKWYAPTTCLVDRWDGDYCVSLDIAEDFESWRPYAVSIHEGGSEGGSSCIAFHTFRRLLEASDFYDNWKQPEVLL